MRTIDWVVLHTAAAYDWKNKRVVYQSTQVIRDFHKRTNGWPDIGYHWVIEEDGAMVRGLLEEQMGSHVGGFNKHSIGVCVTGHGDFAPFKPAQLASVVRLCASICERYKLPGSRVIGHRETDDFGGPPVSKTCPGLLIDMDEVRRLVVARLETA